MLDTGLRPLSNDVDLRQFVSYVPAHRELVVYICEIPPLNVANVPVSPEMVRKRPRRVEPRSCSKALNVEEGHIVSQSSQQSQVTQVRNGPMIDVGGGSSKNVDEEDAMNVDVNEVVDEDDVMNGDGENVEAGVYNHDYTIGVEDTFLEDYDIWY